MAETGRDRFAEAWPTVGIGAAYGAGLGIAMGVVFGGGAGVVAGLAIGAGLGVVAGAVVEMLRHTNGHPKGNGHTA